MDRRRFSFSFCSLCFEGESSRVSVEEAEDFLVGVLVAEDFLVGVVVAEVLGVEAETWNGTLNF